MKICTKCKKEKLESEFHKRKKSKDGLHSWCKDCCKEHDQGYYLEHKEERQELKRKYYQEHGEERWAYNQTENGKEVKSRSYAKRKCSLGFILFDIFGKAFSDLKNDFHHCNNAIVVKIPRTIHMNNYGVDHRQKIADYFRDQMNVDTFQELLLP